MFVLTSLIIFILTGFHERTAIVLKDQKTGETKMLFPDDNYLKLGYTHSVLLTPVDEFFEITDDKKLVLYKTVYESLGVGLPYEQLSDTDFAVVDGKFELNLERHFDDINMIISPIAKHTITVNGNVQNILDLFSSPEQTTEHARSIKIYVVTKSVFELGISFASN